MNEIFKEITQEKLELYLKLNKWHRYQDTYQRTSWNFGNEGTMKTMSAMVPTDRKMTVEEITQAVIKISEAEDRFVWIVAGDIYETEVNPRRYIRTREELLKKVIPHGDYCYDKHGCCPFWEKWDHLPDQGSGYCFYLETGDFTKNGTMLLWDQIKCCGINNTEDEDVK